ASQLGLALMPSESPIQPLMIGDEASAMAISTELQQRGLWVTAIRPPTVPNGSSRLRITLTAAHTTAQIDQLLTALDELIPESLRLPAADIRSSDPQGETL
ncbi:aminotransferase class I/II-fold pyridoxal phosphate-dependent enzyme, partial [Gilvimarinus sp. 1_MG-2023]